MLKEPRHSHVSLKVLKFFIDRPGQEMSGAEIGKALKIASGSLYPILFRYEQVGWLQSEWEDADPASVGRPRRRLYKLGDVGTRKATAIIEELSVGFEREPQWVPG